MAQTPTTIFVPKGSQSIKLVMPGFTPFVTQLDVPSRIFAHVPFSASFTVQAELTETEPFAALLAGAEYFAAWSFSGETSDAYQIPMSLSEGVYRSAIGSSWLYSPPKAMNNTDLSQISPFARYQSYRSIPRHDPILRGAARFVSSKASLADLLRAKFLGDNAGRAPSPLTALYSAGSILRYAAHNPAFTAQVCDLLGEGAKPLFESEWYKKNVIDAVFSLQEQDNSYAATSSNAEISVAGVNFVEVPTGVFFAAPDFQFVSKMSSFYIATTEVTNKQWELFLAENPEWRPENTQNLIDQGLVNSDYLIKTDDPRYPASTVSGVSWYAANAYCKWLTTKLPASIRERGFGWEAQLPTELWWEYAAKAVKAGRLNRRVVTNMLPLDRNGSEGGCWEWCADPFVPLYFLQADQYVIDAIGSPQRSVRGGSWINPAGSLSLETRAGLHPDSCSVFVSFRPVIAWVYNGEHLKADRQREWQAFKEISNRSEP
jgi:hypothetical protein